MYVWRSILMLVFPRYPAIFWLWMPSMTAAHQWKTLYTRSTSTSWPKKGTCSFTHFCTFLHKYIHKYIHSPYGSSTIQVYIVHIENKFILVHIHTHIYNYVDLDKDTCILSLHTYTFIYYYNSTGFWMDFQLSMKD